MEEAKKASFNWKSLHWSKISYAILNCSFCFFVPFFTEERPDMIHFIALFFGGLQFTFWKLIFSFNWTQFGERQREIACIKSDRIFNILTVNFFFSIELKFSLSMHLSYEFDVMFQAIFRWLTQTHTERSFIYLKLLQPENKQNTSKQKNIFVCLSSSLSLSVYVFWFAIWISRRRTHREREKKIH